MKVLFIHIENTLIYKLAFGDWGQFPLGHVDFSTGLFLFKKKSPSGIETFPITCLVGNSNVADTNPFICTTLSPRIFF